MRPDDDGATRKARGMNGTPATLPPEWVRAANPPTASAPPAAKITWLREFGRSNATFLALTDLYGLEAPEHRYGIDVRLGGEAMTVLICALMAERIGEERNMGGIAGRAEWAQAQCRAHQFAEALRKAVWPLGRDGAAGGEIIARARAVNARHGMELSSGDLLAITRKIAIAAATGRRPHGR
jgi:hypothetical protein